MRADGVEPKFTDWLLSVSVPVGLHSSFLLSGCTASCLSVYLDNCFYVIKVLFALSSPLRLAHAFPSTPTMGPSVGAVMRLCWWDGKGVRERQIKGWRQEKCGNRLLGKLWQNTPSCALFIAGSTQWWGQLLWCKKKKKKIAMMTVMMMM